MNKKISIIISLILSILIAVKLYNYYNQERLKPIKIDIEKNRDLDIVFGHENAKITLFIYANYSCGYCKRFFNVDYPRLLKEYINKGLIKVIYRPVTHKTNTNTFRAYQTLVCISKYGHKEKLHQLLLTESKIVNNKEFIAMCQEFIDKDENVAECMLGGNSEKYLLENRQDFNKFDFIGTPTFVINNKAYQGYLKYKKLKKIINKELNLLTKN